MQRTYSRKSIARRASSSILHSESGAEPSHKKRRIQAEVVGSQSENTAGNNTPDGSHCESYGTYLRPLVSNHGDFL